jgi:hypothetical protein
VLTSSHDPAEQITFIHDNAVESDKFPELAANLRKHAMKGMKVEKR